MPREKLYNRKTDTRTARLFVIACEGEATEALYFEELADGLRRVRVLPLPAVAGQAAPKQVLERLNASGARRGLKPDDELWMVIDVDHYFSGTHEDSTRRALDEAAQRGYNVAISNRCFEAWLLYHFEAVAPHESVAELVARLRLHLGGYSKNRSYFEKLRPHVTAAMRRAKEADTSPAQRLPDHPGSRVYRLLEAMRATSGASWPFEDEASSS
jgi:hypothetical protein